MVQYQCPRCGYKSSKYNVKRHIKNINQKSCALVLNDIVPTEEHIIILNNSFNCEFCQKSYTTKSSLKRHQVTTCQTRIKQLESENARLQEKLKEVELKQQTNSTTINNPTFNIQINVNGYRQTSFEHLTDRKYKRAIGRMIYSVPQMIENVHFDPKVPENHNIYISNIKNKYAMVWDGNKWCSKPQDQVIDQLINDQEYAIEEWLGEGDNFPKEMKKFNEYLEKKENSNKAEEIKEVIKEEVKLLLYNNRKIITFKT